MAAESWGKIMDSTLSASWSKLLPAAVNADLPRDAPTRETVENIMSLAHNIGGEGFVDIQENEVMEVLLPGGALNAEDIEQLLQDSTQEDEAKDEEAPQEKKEGILKRDYALINSIFMKLFAATTQIYSDTQ
ncbi:hypothetical protein QAD02_019627 [Eretmocerus hayati]|uniref:Uncharacterized protein n=1 Tax=Eretmocerus hayati TaxID=131215 RepID=A0ACC2PPX2_9HYME|nr:hypothetical protein QAD02_019627 [Eretmocerus hayati]